MATTNGTDMVNKLKGKNEIEEKKPKTLAQFIESMKPELQKALPKHLTADRIARIALTALRTNEKLAGCDPMSFVAALMQSAQAGLEPNTALGEAYLIPYGKEVQFQMGYKGLISLAHRSGEYQTIYAMEVYANDEFHYEYGLDPKLKHIPADEPEGEPVYYYAVYKLKNGGSGFTVWSKDKIIKHSQKYSQAVKKGYSSPWKTDFDAMAKKTVLKDVLKYAPKSIEFARQVSMDETVKNEISNDMSEIPSHDIDFVEADYEVSKDRLEKDLDLTDTPFENQ
ncbi:recombinase RecT [Anaerosolibacter sp.]|uniref:recombinase RecT n=1 Tax=Anaerosolibacter sp. TaxID=1872527 RepID=UPI0039F0874A